MANARTHLLAALAVGVLLGGCRAEEQNRPLSFEKGVYHGQADEKLGEAQRRDLQERGNLMR